MVAMQTSSESLGELCNLRYSYQPIMPDVYMPYQTMEELPQTMALRKQRRRQRKIPRVPKMNLETQGSNVIVRRETINELVEGASTPVIRDELSTYQPLASDLKRFVEPLPEGTPD